MADTIYIVDYGAGNLHSIAKAVEKACNNTRKVCVGSDPKAIASASHVILPGVGAFGDCINGLKAQPGVIEALHKHTIEQEKPFLGICVGMQMLADQGLEHGTHQGLGWISGTIRPIPDTIDLPIPHMGWNNLEIIQDHPILKGIESGDHAYFVHSFYFDCVEKQPILSMVDYGMKIPAIVTKNSIIATQFHPEKSQKCGIIFLRNFLEL
jgi:glutamine amidotransferase